MNRGEGKSKDKEACVIVLKLKRTLGPILQRGTVKDQFEMRKINNCGHQKDKMHNHMME